MSSLSPPSSITRARSSSTAGNLTQARSRAATSTTSPSSAQSADSSSPADTTARKGPSTQTQQHHQQDPESPSKPSAKMLNVLLTMSRVITQDALQLGGSAAPKEKNSVDLTAALKAGGGGKVVTWEDEKKAATSLLAAGGAIADRAVDLVQQQRRGQLQRTRPPPPSAKPRRAGHKRQPSPFSSLFISPPPLSPLPPPAVSSPRTSSFAGRFSPSSFHLPHLSSRPSSPSSASAPSPTSPSSLLPPTRILLPIFFVCSLFFITLLPIVIGVWTLPLHSIKHLPRTVQDIKQVARELNEYASSGFYGTAHIFAVLAVTSIWKNAWSVPGSAVLNVLAGALMNPLVATLLQTLLTTVGSICSSLLSKPLAPVIAHVFPRAMSLTRSAFEGTTYTPYSSPSASRRGSVDDDGAPIEETEKLLDPTSPSSSSSSSPKDVHSKQTPIWVRLTILRLVGVVPWSALNLACGICDIPLWDCAVGGFIGMLPWTAVTCQIGDILQTVASSTASEEAAGQTLSSLLTSPSIIFKLVFLSLLSLGPVLLRDKLSELLSGSRKSSSSRSSLPRHPRRSDDSGSSTAYEEDLEEAEFEVKEKL